MHDSEEVDDDRDVDGDPTGLERRRAANHFVELEWDEQRGRDDRQPLRPALPVEEAHALDQLEHPVGERAGAEELHLVPLQVSGLRDQVLDEVPPRVELDRAGEMVRDAAEVRARVREQVDPGREQKEPAQRTLERDQPEETVAAVDRRSLRLIARLR